MISATQLNGFFPIRVSWGHSRPQIDWCFMGEERFTESFFDQTVSRRLTLPFNQLFRPQTPVETLLERAAQHPGLPPSGFIFHMSRCGSTLVSQMLAALPQNSVISEAGPLDAMIRANSYVPNLAREDQVAWIRAMTSALAQPTNPEQTRFFIKFDCINTLSLPLIHEAFPETPWIFIFRDPVEVLVSQTRQRGGLLLPGVLDLALLGLRPQQLQQMSLDEYGALLLGKICEAALEYVRSYNGLLINYRQLPEALCSLITAHFQLHYLPRDIERMQHVTQFHAKNPHFQFTGDSEAKKLEATPEIHALARRWLTGPCEQLESRRKCQEEKMARIQPESNKI